MKKIQSKLDSLKKMRAAKASSQKRIIDISRSSIDTKVEDDVYDSSDYFSED